MIDTLGTRVRADAFIEIHDDAMSSQAELVTILINKPIGYVSGQAEDGYEPASVLVLPENRWARTQSDQFQAGACAAPGTAGATRYRLDGAAGSHPGRARRTLADRREFDCRRNTWVRVEGRAVARRPAAQPRPQSRRRHALPAQVSWQNEDQLRFVLREGRKRQIRRMCELVGLKVVGLKRVRIGSVSLGQLPVGQWRYLRRDEKF